MNFILIIIIYVMPVIPRYYIITSIVLTTSISVYCIVQNCVYFVIHFRMFSLENLANVVFESSQREPEVIPLTLWEQVSVIRFGK